ncbi:MAG TPA: hypothetical protein VGF13_11950, partial [Verrucomicrobiae bacterium]
MMTTAETISIISACIAVSSFTVSIMVALRDRARVKAKCSFVPPCHNVNVNDNCREPASIFVELINKGRRQAIITGFVREAPNKQAISWARMGPKETGYILGENGRYTTTILAKDCDA